MGHAMVRAGPARSRRTGGPTWCTPTTGWWPTPRSRWPNSSTCHWFPPSTPPRPAGTPAGCPGRMSRQVHALESWLAHESDSLITCSASMRDEITELFGPDLAEITVIPNGIDTAGWPFATRAAHAGPAEAAATSAGWSTRRACTTRSPRCPGSGAPIPGTTLTIAGDGTQLDLLDRAGPQAQGAQGGRFRRPRRSRRAAARCCTEPTPPCCPSHYEPFGIVALEAAAAGAPLVTSNVGRPGRGGDRRRRPGCPSRRATSPGWPRPCARCSTIPAAAQRRAVAARERLTSDFAWQTVADETAAGVPGRQTRVSANRSRAGRSSSGRCRTAADVQRPALRPRTTRPEVSCEAGATWRLSCVRCRPASAASSARWAAEVSQASLRLLDHLGRRADGDRVVGDLALDHGVRAEHAAAADRGAAQDRHLGGDPGVRADPHRALDDALVLDRQLDAVHLVVEVADVAPVGHQRGIAELDVEVGVDDVVAAEHHLVAEPQRALVSSGWCSCRRCAPSGRSPSGPAPGCAWISTPLPRNTMPRVMMCGLASLNFSSRQ